MLLTGGMTMALTRDELREAYNGMSVSVKKDYGSFDNWYNKRKKMLDYWSKKC